jgi:uncharacterized protein YjlB
MDLKELSVGRQFAEYLNAPRVIAHRLKEDGAIPNNSILPLLIYQNALKLPQQEAPSIIERLVEGNQWGGTWRNGIYTYHHYHSTAHEVLIVFAGTADVQLGGNKGVTQTFRRGDVVIIPAGVSHKNLSSSRDFAIVGAYPEGQEPDMNYGKAAERAKARENIARVELPKADPIYGQDGILMEHWLK